MQTKQFLQVMATSSINLDTDMNTDHFKQIVTQIVTASTFTSDVLHIVS